MRTCLPACRNLFLLFFIIASNHISQAQILKSLVYDFDGLNIDETDLPEGDYAVNDLAYHIAQNPLAASDMLGDRVLKLNLNWSTNYGAFGRGISRFIEFDPLQDKFNFFLYNPVSNNQDAVLDVVITDDDNQDNMYSSIADDTWKKSLLIHGSGSWQFFSIPLQDFTDANTGGNGTFDIDFTQNRGMLLMVEFRFTKSPSSTSNPVFYLDMINFSDGDMPRGATVFDLPGKNPSDYCLLGGYQSEPRGNEYLIPSAIEGLFPSVPGKKLKYANYFLQFAMDGTTTAKVLPGNEVQLLINNGYRPIITWEPLFQGYDRLDPLQPRLSNIINGDYDTYLDQFADKIKTYTDTVIIRFMHEFEGNWYPWSISQNNQDPNLYKAAFRRVVDRFRARGATNVKWMWCVNSDYFPYLSYNWIVPAYPGDNYVDIVATDIYNNHYPTTLPWWRSFRWQATESYYYLSKYFPQKPLFMCELGCRERYTSENTTSQSKGAWYSQMDKELQSDFHRMRALVFFNANHEQNWLINSSPSALQSLTDNIWYDNYYFSTGTAPVLNTVISSPSNNSSFSSNSNITITATVSGGTGPIRKVEFYSGNAKVGQDSISPYGFTWNNVPIGTYQLTAKATDSAGATATSAVVNISVGSCTATGKISRELWLNVSGTTVSSIPLSSPPGSTGILTLLEAPQNIGDNYGQRLRGYICAPATGNYIFWIASDDNSELWLSTNDQPSNKHRIAYNNQWTFSREWTKYASQQSAPISLAAGQKYYIEVLHKEGSQGDNLAVGWQLPDGTYERPIPGSRLAEYNAVPSSVNEPISAGSTWRYLDNGSNQGTAWRSMSFDDASWKTGNAQLGYGDGDETTVMGYGPSSSNKYITTYFRKKFNVSNTTGITGLELDLLRDDGAVVYLNGTEIFRSNMPTGTISYNTLSNTNVNGSAESAFAVANLGAGALITGDNIISVEIHQQSVQSSDISFDLRLKTVSGGRMMDSLVISSDASDSINAYNGALTLYPNPNSGRFEMEYCDKDPAEDAVTVEVYNSAGQLVLRRELKMMNHCIRETIELDKNTPTGIYIMNVVGLRGRKSQRLVLTD
ncbi:MAG TPA: Ig-like domain-containing protein [Bacteroidia bacterium]|jgi:beta-mannanase